MKSQTLSVQAPEIIYRNDDWINMDKHNIELFHSDSLDHSQSKK